MKITDQEITMNRRDFLKKMLLVAAGWTIFKWLKPFEDATVSMKPHGLREAEFYRPADHLAG
jgi:hypothetical protein